MSRFSYPNQMSWPKRKKNMQPFEFFFTCLSSTLCQFSSFLFSIQQFVREFVCTIVMCALQQKNVCFPISYKQNIIDYNKTHFYCKSFSSIKLMSHSLIAMQFNVITKQIPRFPSGLPYHTVNRPMICILFFNIGSMKFVAHLTAKANRSYRIWYAHWFAFACIQIEGMLIYSFVIRSFGFVACHCRYSIVCTWCMYCMYRANAWYMVNRILCSIYLHH